MAGKLSNESSMSLDRLLRAGAKGVLIVTVSADGMPEMTTNIERESCMDMLRHMLDPDNAEGMLFPDDLDEDAPDGH